MNKQIALVAVLILIIGSVVVGIALSKNGDSSAEVAENPTNTIEVPSELVTTEATEATSSEPVANGPINPLTGLPTSDGIALSRPIVVMLDNHFAARPQAALSEADVVYEILAEGLITRYMAVFYENAPEVIGPVRSARPYFLEKALEFDPYYVHVGGSVQAFKDIKAYQMADLDGLVSGAFYRVNFKKSPHNMYTSAEALVKEGDRLGYDAEKTVQFLNFFETFTVPEGDDAVEITFIYKEPVETDKIGYFTSYRYNDVSKLYSRYTNGDAHVDENTGDQLTCTNILVQYANTKVLDKEGRLDVDLITSGKGKYYTAGKVMEVTWKKTSAKEPTEFFDLSGNPIKLNPGITWFQIMKTGVVEKIK